MSVFRIFYLSELYESGAVIIIVKHYRDIDTIALNYTRRYIIMAMATVPVKTGCSAYDDLNTRLRQSYVSYGKLIRQDGELGKHPGMYVLNPDCINEEMPAEHTSDYLRGGVISAVATFEAFLGDLIKDATDLVAKKYKHENGCQNKRNCELKKYNENMCKRYNQPEKQRKRLKPKGVTIHKWVMQGEDGTDFTYLEYLTPNANQSIFDVILNQGDFIFNYRINTPKVSQITISAENPAKQRSNLNCLICVMLRFCYGIRNVMAHGNAERTFDDDGGTLNNFTKKCNECNCQNCHTCECFEDTVILLTFYNSYIKQLDDDKRKDAESRVRRIPKIEVFRSFQKIPVAQRLDSHDTESSYESYNSKDEESEDTESEAPPSQENYENDLPPNIHAGFGLDWEEYEKIFNDHFPDPEMDPLPASYAYFHMLRVYYWLVESKRNMFVTYTLFERITQFIHTLAFRMYLAVAEVLIDNCPKIGNEVWGVEKHNIGTKITRFITELKTQ